MSLTLGQIALVPYDPDKLTGWIPADRRLQKLGHYVRVSYKEVRHLLSEKVILSICEPFLDRLSETSDVLYIFFEGDAENNLVSYIRVIRKRLEDKIKIVVDAIEEKRPTSLSWGVSYLCVVLKGQP